MNVRPCIGCPLRKSCETLEGELTEVIAGAEAIIAQTTEQPIVAEFDMRRIANATEDLLTWRARQVFIAAICANIVSHCPETEQGGTITGSVLRLLGIKDCASNAPRRHL